MSSWVVMKFGGTSVATVSRWKTIAEEAHRLVGANQRPVIVCSAVSGVSDRIETIIALVGDPKVQDAVEALEQQHLRLAEEMGIKNPIESELTELKNQVQGASLIGEVSPRIHARLMSLGERMSTKLGAAYLNSLGLNVRWVDARDHLRSLPKANASTERQFLSAECDFEADPAMQQALASEPGAVITQGFIARNGDGDTVLLGRGGSDTSAAYFAAKLNAVRCEIWTDVPGMFTADPRHVPTARVLRSLDYDEAQEIATMGAKVLHPRAIPPCKSASIPIVIRCTPRPELNGTVIHSRGLGNEAGVKAISARKGVMLISMETVGMWQTVGFLADAFAVFKRLGLSIDLVSTSETNVTVSLDPSANRVDDATLESLADGLRSLCDVTVIGPCASISLVGRQIRSLLHRLGAILGLFEEQQIHLLSQAASDLNLTFVVDEPQLDRLISKLHARLFDHQTENSVFGPSHDALFERTSSHGPPVLDWWSKRKGALIKSANDHGPCFVIDPHSIDDAASALNGMTALDRRFYAIKANAHPDVLKRLHAAGFGFETVSPGELDHVKNLFPDLPTDRLLYTPNFAPKEDYEHGFSVGAMVTVDNLHPLRHWPETFRGKAILLRIDPGKGRGHHAHVRTAGAQSKFGIAPDELDAVAEAVSNAGATVFALHAHAGSGILTPEGWAETARFLVGVATRFPTVKALDLGGGLGIAEKPDQRPLNLSAVNDSLLEFKRAHPSLELWMEPGRFLVAHAGVLLARVTQIKTKGEITYVGIETGMNSLIRPALYGAYHPIVNLSRLDEPRTVMAHIVGPICETGDVLGHARHIAPPAEGDIILIGNTGAYGRTMSSQYNRRKPAEEFILPE